MPSISVMSNHAGTTIDTSGGPTDGDYYVTTDINGKFDFYFTCSPGDQLYAYAMGGVSSSAITLHNSWCWDHAPQQKMMLLQ
jgi:hypothetical protein